MAKQFSLSVLFKAIDKMSAPMRRIGRRMRRTGSSVKRLAATFRHLGRRAAAAGKQMIGLGKSLSLKLTAPIVGFGVLAIRSATSFQAAMNFVRAVTKATDREFNQLKKTAKDLGRTTQFSATQAAEAMKFLGLAGLSVSEIIGSMPKVLELAASGQLDLASAAEIVTNIMFGLSKGTEELAEVNDVLVNAFTSAKVDLVSLGQAFRKGGTELKVAGVDFKTTTALLMGLGQVGRVGSEAGRGLRRMVVELGKLRNASKKEFRILRKIGINPKEIFDTNGQLIDMVEILRKFKRTNIDLTDAVELFGQFGGPTLLGLLETGADGIEEYRKKLNEVGSASRVAESQMEGLPGAVKRLVSVWEALQLAIVRAGLGDIVLSIMEKISNLIEKLSKLNPKLLLIGTIIAGVAAAIPPLLIGLGMLSIAFGVAAKGFAVLLGLGKVGIVFKFLTGVVMGLGAALKALVVAHPIAAIVAALVVGGILVWRYWEPIKGFFLNLPKYLSKAWEHISRFFSSLGSKAKGILPDFLKEPLGVSIKTKEIKPIGVSLKGERNKTDINIKVSSEPGTTALVEKVKNAGANNVNIATVGFVGATP